MDRPPLPWRYAIAIGPTTFDALLAETTLGPFDTISLPEPTPEALRVFARTGA